MPEIGAENMELNEQVVRPFVNTRQLILLELVSGVKILGIITDCGEDWLVFKSISQRSILNYIDIQKVKMTQRLAEEELTNEAK
jgi:hypothetical protein